jgi:hypothetical protein
MKEDFERRLKQKLEQATPEELGYRPDKEQLWNRITTQQKKPKTLPLVTWITHAAAIAAGLLIGAFFLNWENQPAAVQLMPDVVSSQKLKIRTDTVYVLQSPGAHKDPEKVVPATAVNQARPHRETGQPTAAQEQIVQKQEIPAPKMERQETTIARNQQPPKVLHLSDIGNENAIPQSRIIKMPILVQLFSSPNLQDDRQASASASALIRQQAATTKN